mgnify:CR=1 FL=1
MARAGDLDLEETQGDDWRVILTFQDVDSQPIDMSDGDYSAQVRKTATSSTLLAEFTVDDSDAADGEIVLTLDAEDTAELPAVCVWDFQRVTGAGETVTILSGSIRVRREVTR